MEIALHLGVHCTDQDQLVRCLMRNRAPLLAQGIAVPGPGSYRQQLRQLAMEMRDRDTSAATQEALLDGILEADEVRRVVFSVPNQLAMARWAVTGDRLYPAAGERLALTRRLFPDARVEVFLALRNPATLLPALAAGDSTGVLAAELAGVDAAALRWSAMLADMVRQAPGVPITVWCDEDTPLLWPEVLRAVSGHAAGLVLEGWLAWYWPLVTPQAHEAMRRWFQTNPPADDATRKRMLSALLARLARPEATEPDPPLPGWDADMVESLSEAYQADLDLVASIPGVRLLEP